MKAIKLKLPAYDIVGDIAIFNELGKKDESKAKRLLKMRNIGVVAKKTKKYSGKYRLPKIKIVAGEKRKETLHKENNVQVKLDIEKCYFSSRLANERKRAASLVKENEDILVMFSGIGIYGFVIAKNSKAREVYCIELNPVACKYAEENRVLNKLWNIRLFRGDVKRIVPKLDKKFDRVIMPLPKTGEKFLYLAEKVIKKNGMIHFYYFLKENEIEKMKKDLKEKIKCRSIKAIKCGQFSPYVYRVCFDIKK
ncbi:MAG: methyltransferase [Nanoarchaeota archaeon]